MNEGFVCGRCSYRDQSAAKEDPLSCNSSAVPKTITELYQLFEKMKTDFETRLTQLEKSNKSLVDEINEKDIQISRLKASEAAHKEAMKQQTAMQKVVDSHQSFLEKTDSYRRECNVVIYGLTESTKMKDAEQVKEVLAEMQCTHRPRKMRETWQSSGG